MNKFTTGLLTALAATLTLGISMNACAGLFGIGGTSWKEEAQLHDGRRIIVKRSQTYGGRSEPFRPAPVATHTVSFVLPESGRRLEWSSDYDDSLGRTNFNALALHLLGDTPYLVVEPNLCLSYNKWGRPNPPYIVFKHDGADWQRLPMAELPGEFKTINLVANNGREEDIAKATAGGLGHVSAADVTKLNSSLTQPQYRSIIREPLPAEKIGCREMVPDGNGGWMGTGFSSRQPSYEACLNYCEANRIRTPYCLCDRYFKQGN